MLSKALILGIDLGTSGVRVAIINLDKKLIYLEEISYKVGIEEPNDWANCLEILIRKIPKIIKLNIISCAVSGTSGTLLACHKDGKPTSKAIPYYKDYLEKRLTINKLFSSDSRYLYNASSLRRGLHLLEINNSKIILRHQSDWISGWLIDDWSMGEEASNIKLGWNQADKCWPKSFFKQNLINKLPIIIKSGGIMKKISFKKANKLGLNPNTIIYAGTTDSNASVLSVEPNIDEGVTILGSTIVIKKFNEYPIIANGISNHLLNGKWLCGGASNSGPAVLRQFFSDRQISELSRQIDPKQNSGLNYYPLPRTGERFPIEDECLEPKLHPRPISDALFIHGLLEGLTYVEKLAWEKFKELGISMPKRIITLGGGSQNPQWKKIREKNLMVPIVNSKHSTAFGTALIAHRAYTHSQR
tara:strand:+ start:388 stop:1635 length:1248 start_codon:yes stop_codon:yes gene_type:complete